MRLALLSELVGTVLRLGTDELRVLLLIAKRLRGGARQYGRLDVARDPRDWRREAREEWADAAVYAACELLKRTSS